MASPTNADSTFYESFWTDAAYQQSYAFDSAVRDRFPAIQNVWGELALPNRVLDFGSGNGVLTYWMRRNGFGTSILGVDVSHTGIANARAAFACEGLRYEHVDYLANLSNGEVFDVVVSSHVLEHIPAPEKTLARLRELGTWFVLEVPLELCLWQSIVFGLRGKERHDNPLGHVNFWTKTSFQRLLEENGFLIVRDYHYASAPYSPYNPAFKRLIERALLKVIGLAAYSRLMATHYTVLARRR